MNAQLINTYIQAANDADARYEAAQKQLDTSRPFDFANYTFAEIERSDEAFAGACLKRNGGDLEAAIEEAQADNNSAVLALLLAAR